MPISIDKYLEIGIIIEDTEEDVEFGDGVPQRWIDIAESRLGFNLPDSYKWWLLNYGGGDIYGDEVYSLYGPDISDAQDRYSGDIVYQYESNIKNGILTKDQLAVFNMDGDEYYFDLKNAHTDSEYPIYSSMNNDGPYANNFLEFLEKQINTTEF